MVNMNLLIPHGLNYSKNNNISQNTVYTALKGKGRPSGSQYQQKRKRTTKQEAIATTSSYQTINN